MPGIIEILQGQARQRGRFDQNPLVLLHTFESHPGARISHLPINQQLIHAWVTLTGEPFRPHQSLALSALRRGEPFALVSTSAAVRKTLHLLLYEVLMNEPYAGALLIAPDEVTAGLHLAEIERLNKELHDLLPMACIDSGKFAREAMMARVLLVTPETLHTRLLRHHDRAWRLFWSYLRLIVLTDLDSYNGISAAHLSALLSRSTRLTPTAASPLLAATLASVTDIDTSLQELSGQSWRIITVDDTPRAATNLAIWRAGDACLREAGALASAFQREGYTVHITCPQLELSLLPALIGSDTYGVSFGPVLRSAHVQILAGYPHSPTTLRQAIESGSKMTVLLLGNQPHERTLTRLVGKGEAVDSLINNPVPTWAAAPTNAYVTARHVICAASERPLIETDIERWQIAPIVKRLEQQQQLGLLPDPEAAWRPLPAAGDDPYSNFALTVAGNPPVILRDERGTFLDTLDPSLLDRWAFINATLPPRSSVYRVVRQHEETNTLILSPEQHGRRTFPLRRCEVSVREEREQRVMRGCTVGWGRVIIDEEIYGYREAQAGGVSTECALKPTLSSRWTAPATWIDLPITLMKEAARLPITGQQIGWSLTAALPLSVICASTDIVPAYDTTRNRIYLVDAQPGGNGLALWLYKHLEETLPRAYDIALDCRNDNLFDAVMQADKDWLLPLLGGIAVAPEQTPTTDMRASSIEPLAQLSPTPQKTASSQRAQAIDVGSDRSSHDHKQTFVPSQSQEANAPVAHSGAIIPTQKQFDNIEEPRRSPVTRRSRTKSPSQPPSEHNHAPAQHYHQQTDAQLSPSSKPRPTHKAKAEPPTKQRQTPSGEHDSNATAPDPKAMIARLRRLRQQREAAATPTVKPKPQRSTHQMPALTRFAPGDRIFCIPYGYGDVRASWIEHDKERLNVEFPDFGELTIDPAVSMARRIDKSDDPPESQ